jgi:hypothetical protein
VHYASGDTLRFRSRCFHPANHHLAHRLALCRRERDWPATWPPQKKILPREETTIEWSARRADTNGSSSLGRMKKMALVFRWKAGTLGHPS